LKRFHPWRVYSASMQFMWQAELCFCFFFCGLKRNLINELTSHRLKTAYLGIWWMSLQLLFYPHSVPAHGVLSAMSCQQICHYLCLCNNSAPDKSAGN
jgi:hypothetical protein